MRRGKRGASLARVATSVLHLGLLALAGGASPFVAGIAVLGALLGTFVPATVAWLVYMGLHHHADGWAALGGYLLAAVAIHLIIDTVAHPLVTRWQISGMRYDRVEGNLSIKGEPGAGLASGGAFSDENTAKGIEGEKRTVEMLVKALSGLPVKSVLVNSVEFAGSRNADVDHVLIVGNKGYLIDSKNWSGGDYELLDSQAVGSRSPSTGRTATRTVHMDAALANQREAVPWAEWPTCWIIVHHNGQGRDPQNVTAGRAGDVVFCSATEAVEMLADLVCKVGGKPNRALVSEVNAHRKH